MERYDLMGTPTASSEEAGVLRIASEVDEKNCGCVDAAITPSNLYNLLGCRKANTAYVGNEVVACPYHTEFLLKCVQAGSTATGSLDTTNVTKGQVIDDGGAKWEVIQKLTQKDIIPIKNGGTGVEAEGVADIANALGLAYIGFASGNLEKVPSDADLNDYIKAGNYYITSGTVANSLINAPDIGGNGRLVVMENVTNYGAQIIFNTNWRGFWYRTFYKGTGDFVFSDWVNFSGCKDGSLGTQSGYIRLGGIVENFIIAWKRVFTNDNKKTTVVTKPVPFTTYIAVPTDIDTTSGGERHSFSWYSTPTTDTTDTFHRPDTSSAFSILWIGKAV